jgi:type II secretion system protein G
MKSKRRLSVIGCRLSAEPLWELFQAQTVNRQPTTGNRRTGFTLVEMLVVIAVIGLLGSLILGGVMAAKRQANRNHTRTIIQLLGAAIDQYENDWGDYPPGDGQAGGAEDLYSALTSPANTRAYVSGGQPAAVEQAETGRKAFVDFWRNPLRYTHHRHYSGDPRADEYRLESAGPDGRFGTDDDLNNWKK